MKIAIAQVNTTIGDFEGNREKIRDFTVRAQSLAADLVVFPELSLCGYPPMDLLDHRAFGEQNQRSLRWLQQNLPGDIAVLLGYVDTSTGIGGKALQNTVGIIHRGELVFRQAKRLLPTYDFFNEVRYFEPAEASRVFSFAGIRLGIAICEDVWWEIEPAPGTRYSTDPVRDLLDKGAELILAPSASPFHRGKPAIRQNLVRKIGKNNGIPTVYTNLVGANDSLIFDGYSFVCDGNGRIVHQSPGFVEDLSLLEVERNENRLQVRTDKTESSGEESREENGACADIEKALILGIRDYLAKTGFSRVHLGLSGGIDSAVVATLAQKALGHKKVRAFLMPSRYSSSGSVPDAEQLCRTLDIERTVLPIQPAFETFLDGLPDLFSSAEPDVMEENIQARIRGILVMAYSNRSGSLTLTAGNKSELAVGYATMYGDMAGGLAVIGDLFKTEVYELARFINREREIIPEAILSKAPSAELRPDQKDQDSLPPYDVLDKILHLYLVESKTFSEIVRTDLDPLLVGQVLRLVGRAEYKRRQAPPVLKVSSRAFGTGRRMPIARHIYEDNR